MSRASRVVFILLGLGCGGSEGPALTPGIFAQELGAPTPRADADQRETFERGRKLAERRFTPEEGLGPTFNVASCAACHEKPVAGGAAGRYRDFLLEGSVQDDGSLVLLGKNGIQDQFSLAPPVRVPTPVEVNHTATRNPIAFFGAGLLAEIPDAEILRRADADDRDHDGISGRPNYDRGFVGRFGVKAQTVSIEKFIRGPLFNHLGITSDPLSDEQRARLPVPSAAAPEMEARLWSLLGGVARAQVAAPDEPTRDMDGAPDPELSPEQLFDLVSFTMLLAPPQPDAPNQRSERGRKNFMRIGCGDCHVPALQGPGGLVPAYSDLLLHDMGPDLADGVSMGEAEGSEFRTAPLWGVAATAPYLHDGRADTLEQAIEAHAGEAERSRRAYAALSDDERAHLREFLESLGGAAQYTQGLLPPDAGVPEPGTYGGPNAALDPADTARFLAGRALFDRDVSLQLGLGPRFNGDSCRACHFLPVIGGAGPADVDVTRHGLLDDRGQFNPPSIGTVAHRHEIDGKRPPIDADATLFERRQTPSLFGLGLIEQIDGALLEQRADPDDADGDGISGRVYLLADGSVGRFGWKANVATLSDFVRDALSTELGVTVPDDPQSPFGKSQDDDRADDPEYSSASIQELAFFLRALAPPPRTHGDDRAAEQRGEALFDVAGCGSCHVPSLPTASGADVRLFSDLLLHDVADAAYVGIGEGSAKSRELRTPPLWGLQHGAPYLHDGAASSVEAAIAKHESEGAAARAAFEALNARQRADLLAFLDSL
jgi:CxxC motif-containing protein (DUF1111 family)